MCVGFFVALAAYADYVGLSCLEVLEYGNIVCIREFHGRRKILLDKVTQKGKVKDSLEFSSAIHLLCKMQFHMSEKYRMILVQEKKEKTKKEAPTIKLLTKLTGSKSGNLAMCSSLASEQFVSKSNP